jgi:two-component system CheB/CheR fusion protein
VVLLDIGLPELDGYQVARHLRGSHSQRELLLVALTGYGHEEAVHMARQAGFDHHLVKPIDIDTLCQILDERAQDMSQLA